MNKLSCICPDYMVHCSGVMYNMNGSNAAIVIYIFMSSCVGGSKAPPGTISAIYTRYAGTISNSYKNFR